MPPYTASATAHGARAGHVRSDNGRVDLDLAIPEELGGPGGNATNPEELFAAGYAACFQGALGAAAGKRDIDVSGSDVTARVTISDTDYALSVELEVKIPGVDRETALKLAESAHRICPYSRATRDNIDVALSVAE
jgi:Ohr subfamily peroxiredoxin